MSSEVLQNVQKPQACRTESTGVPILFGSKAEQKLPRSSLVHDVPSWKERDRKIPIHGGPKCWSSQGGKRVTNHSVRKSCISRLLAADIPENFVAQLTGHKSTESLQSCKSASSNHQRRMSLTLSRARSSSEKSTAVSNVEDLRMASWSSSQNVSSIAAVNSMMNSSVDPLLSSTAPVFAGANIGSQWLHFPDFSWKRENSSSRKKASTHYWKRRPWLIVLLARQVLSLVSKFGWLLVVRFSLSWVG